MGDLFSNFISIKPNRKVSEMRKWKLCFDETCKEHDLFKGNEGIRADVEKGLLRFYYAYSSERWDTFKVENVALTVAFRLRAFNHSDAKVILGFAESFLNKWIQVMGVNEDVCRLLKIDAPVDYGFVRILADRDSVYNEYFKSFSNPEGDILIRVYLPRPNESWIRWEKDNSVVVTIDSQKCFERGFFIVGFDYAVIQDSEEGHLKVGCISASGEYETGLFSTLEIGEITNNVIWAL